MLVGELVQVKVDIKEISLNSKIKTIVYIACFGNGKLVSILFVNQIVVDSIKLVQKSTQIISNSRSVISLSYMPFTKN